jgi:hypothetical protein
MENEMKTVAAMQPGEMDMKSGMSVVAGGNG